MFCLCCICSTSFQRTFVCFVLTLIPRSILTCILYQVRASSDEASGSRLPKRTYPNAEPVAVQQELPLTKEESPEHVPMNPEVHISFIVKGALRGALNNRQKINEHDQGRIEMLIKRAAKKKWGWTEDKIGNLKFNYPDDRIHFNGPLVIRFLFKGPFLDCQLEDCLGEAMNRGFPTEGQPTVSGFIYSMTQNGKKNKEIYSVSGLQ